MNPCVASTITMPAIAEGDCTTAVNAMPPAMVSSGLRSSKRNAMKGSWVRTGSVASPMTSRCNNLGSRQLR